MQDDEVGDGTTSVCILASELLREAEKLVSQRVHPQTIVEATSVDDIVAVMKLNRIELGVLRAASVVTLTAGGACRNISGDMGDAGPTIDAVAAETANSYSPPGVRPPMTTGDWPAVTKRVWPPAWQIRLATRKSSAYVMHDAPALPFLDTTATRWALEGSKPPGSEDSGHGAPMYVQWSMSWSRKATRKVALPGGPATRSMRIQMR